MGHGIPREPHSTKCSGTHILLHAWKSHAWAGDYWQLSCHCAPHGVGGVARGKALPIFAGDDLNFIPIESASHGALFPSSWRFCETSMKLQIFGLRSWYVASLPQRCCILSNGSLSTWSAVSIFR